MCFFIRVMGNIKERAIYGSAAKCL